MEDLAMAISDHVCVYVLYSMLLLYNVCALSTLSAFTLQINHPVPPLELIETAIPNVSCVFYSTPKVADTPFFFNGVMEINVIFMT